MSVYQLARGGCWPTEEQELLLRAIFQPRDQAVKALDQWASKVDVSRLNAGSYRLMPLLYTRLHGMDVEHPLMPDLQEAYRCAHFYNIKRIRNVEQLLKVFQQQGVDTLLLKGMALVQRYYIDPGLRPMSDVDILVQLDQAAAAVRVLQEQGYRAKTYFNVDAPFSGGHALPFINSDSHTVDLHGYLCPEAFVCQYDGGDFWLHSMQLQVNNAQSRALDPADQLLHVCVHGLRWNRKAPLRWIVDAMYVLKKSGDELDWDRFLRHAHTLHLIVLVSEALGYLRDKLNAPIPQRVFSELDSIPVSKIELREYRARTNVSGGLAAQWYGFVLRSEQRGFWRRLSGFARYMYGVWGLKSVWQLPGDFLYRSYRRVRFALTRNE